MNNLNKLFLSDSEAFRKVLLTPFQIKILKFIVDNEIITNKQLSEQYPLPIATAGMQLKEFSDKGYLTRKLVKGDNLVRRGKYVYTVAKGIE